MIRIAIHRRNGSYSERWTQYCENNGIPFKHVNCYDTDIINQLQGCDGLMWHWATSDYKAALAARQIILSLEKAKIKVFPDSNTSWHYDDKVGQKYLLEAIDAPLVKSYVFYSKQDAVKWINITKFPIVFKLRNGGGAYNVKLVKDKHAAKQLINKAFGTGFSRADPYSRLKERIRILKRDKSFKAAKLVVYGIARLFIKKENEKLRNKEKGYIYFQDFIPDNTYDTRIVVIGNRCFGARRFCRPQDFRASGSGLFTYKPELIDKKMIKTAFDVTEKIGAQSLAFDFIIDKDTPRIVEISYCFAIECCDDAPGFWDRNLTWHSGEVNLQYYMIEDFISSLKKQKHDFPKKIIIQDSPA
ncbi:MAG: ATP-grasp domain-containing protein [bacterium]